MLETNIFTLNTLYFDELRNGTELLYFFADNSKNDGKKEPFKMKNSSAWSDPKPTSAAEEDIKPSKSHQGKANCDKRKQIQGSS